jgi:pyruvate formate lyase activating enzyme
MAGFLAGLSPDLPWHVTGFVPQYKMDEAPATPAQTLSRAREIGHEAGLRYVYAGNRPGQIPHGEDTLCPGCGATVVAREGFRVTRCQIENGCCRACGTALAGRWD